MPQLAKGNFGLGSATASEAQSLGEAWIGEGYRVASDGKTLISQDAMRQFRPPTYKPDLGIYQANFEQRIAGQVSRRWFSNGHLDITDLP
jgi:filamentous hemagglutinin